MYLRPVMAKTLANTPNPEAAAMGQQVGFVFGVALVIAYPICVLIFMNKPNVKAAFGAGGSAPVQTGAYPTYPPGGQRPY
jgi:hypothetical protein